MASSNSARRAVAASDHDHAQAASVTAGDLMPLNERIAGALQEAIAAGTFALGSALPTEAALCAQFQASRYTVREALRKLVDLGLIERRQGAGSKVVASTGRTAYFHVFDDLADLFEYARDTHFEVRDVALEAIDEDAASYVRAPVGSRWLKASGVRWSPGRTEIIAHVTVYVHARFAPLLGDLKSIGGAVYGLVEARSGEVIAEALQDISAMPMPPPIARALGRSRGASGMKFVRRYHDASGGVMLTSVNWHAGDRFTYSMRIRRGDWRP